MRPARVALVARRRPRHHLDVGRLRQRHAAVLRGRGARDRAADDEALGLRGLEDVRRALRARARRRDGSAGHDPAPVQRLRRPQPPQLVGRPGRRRSSSRCSTASRWRSTATACRRARSRYVADTVDGIVRALERPESRGEVDQHRRHRDVTILELGRARPGEARPPAEPAPRAHRAATSRCPASTRTCIHRVPDTTKAERLLGFKASRRPRRRASTRTIAWHRAVRAGRHRRRGLSRAPRPDGGGSNWTIEGRTPRWAVPRIDPCGAARSPRRRRATELHEGRAASMPRSRSAVAVEQRLDPHGAALRPRGQRRLLRGAAAARRRTSSSRSVRARTPSRRRARSSGSSRLFVELAAGSRRRPRRRQLDARRRARGGEARHPASATSRPGCGASTGRCPRSTTGG